MRIVSLLPSATEIVCALGSRGELVGRSAECDYPAEVRELPVVMRPRTLDPERPSAEIDARVRRARSAGESLYALDVDLLRRLRPDVLLTQDLCGVCSVTDDEARAACREAGVEPEVVSLTPRTLEEVWVSIDLVGRAIDRGDEAATLVASLRRRAQSARARATGTVAVVEWLDPPILAGLWTPSIVGAAGGTYVGPAPGEVGARTTWDAITDLAPDRVVLSPCSFSVERSEFELRDSALRARVARAAGAGEIWLADEAYFSRPGPRLAYGVELVRSVLDDEDGPFPIPARRWGLALPTAAR